MTESEALASVRVVDKPFRASVLLRHEHPNDPSKNHYDWLFEREDGDDPEARSLLAFRVSARPDESTELDATRLPDHRRRYLTYEGPITGGRGVVTRVWEGDAFVLDTEAGYEFALRVLDGVTRWHAVPIDGDAWRLTRARDPH